MEIKLQWDMNQKFGAHGSRGQVICNSLYHIENTSHINLTLFIAKIPCGISM